MCCDFILVIISIFFPPLPVVFKSGLCSCDVLINIALCMLGYFPGLIHSWYIISRGPRRLDEEEVIYEQHNHYHHYTVVSPELRPASPQSPPAPTQSPQVNYGSTADEPLPVGAPPSYDNVMSETFKP